MCLVVSSKNEKEKKKEKVSQNPSTSYTQTLLSSRPHKRFQLWWDYTIEVVMIIKHFPNNRLTVVSRFSLVTGPTQTGATGIVISWWLKWWENLKRPFCARCTCKKGTITIQHVSRQSSHGNAILLRKKNLFKHLQFTEFTVQNWIHLYCTYQTEPTP